jgi:hypothetical protein
MEVILIYSGSSGLAKHIVGRDRVTVMEYRPDYGTFRILPKPVRRVLRAIKYK